MKLFLTVGSMLPFDRLTQALDDWAAAHPDCEVFGQIGQGGRPARHMATVAMLSPAEYRQRLVWADVLVSHVGMGTVIAAAELGRPLVLMPRDPGRGEVTSEHQQACARWLKLRPGVVVVNDAQELAAALERRQDLGMPAPVAPVSERLLSALRDFTAQALGPV